MLLFLKIYSRYMLPSLSCSAVRTRVSSCCFLEKNLLLAALKRANLTTRPGYVPLCWSCWWPDRWCVRTLRALQPAHFLLFLILHSACAPFLTPHLSDCRCLGLQNLYAGRVIFPSRDVRYGISWARQHTVCFSIGSGRQDFAPDGVLTCWLL